jgi:hypothetical protein
MERRPIFPFASTETGTEVLKVVPVNSTVGTPRSPGILVPALSTVCVHISGTATVVIKSNPFDDPSKDVTLTSLSATGNYVVPSACNLVIHVTANTGTVTCVIIPNFEIK